MPKHTPGPWEAHIEAEPFGIIGEIYADGTYLGRVDSSEVQSSAQEANAQLISAASDMLEAFEMLLPYCPQVAEEEGKNQNKVVYSDIEWRMFVKYYQQAQTAINTSLYWLKKAKGIK